MTVVSILSTVLELLLVIGVKDSIFLVSVVVIISSLVSITGFKISTLVVVTAVVVLKTTVG